MLIMCTSTWQANGLWILTSLNEVIHCTSSLTSRGQQWNLPRLTAHSWMWAINWAKQSQTIATKTSGTLLPRWTASFPVSAGSLEKEVSVCWASFLILLFNLSIRTDAHSRQEHPGSLILSLHHNICLIKSHQTCFPPDVAVCHCGLSWLLRKCPKSALCLLSTCNRIHLSQKKALQTVLTILMWNLLY